MIVLRANPRRQKQAKDLISYIRAGQDTTEHVPEGYYSTQRLKTIGKRLESLLKYNTFEPTRQEDYEVVYLRLCERCKVQRLVVLADWQAVLDVIADRIQFYLANNLTMSGLTVLALNRFWKVVLALHRGE